MPRISACYGQGQKIVVEAWRYRALLFVAAAMAFLAWSTGTALNKPLSDPDGFLGPSWTRIPLMTAGAVLLSVVPVGVWRARKTGEGVRLHIKQEFAHRWTLKRFVLAVCCLSSFHIIYVSYRNLKSHLPTFFPQMQDPFLHQLDKILFLGADPAILLQNIFGTSFSAHFLSAIYIAYLPIAPIALISWLVWSKDTRIGYWFASAHCLTWVLGTASYYAIPTMGPAFWYPWIYSDLSPTGVTALQDALWESRQDAVFGPAQLGTQSIAGFASLHVALTLVIALMVHYTISYKVVKVIAWLFFALTTIATIYFGWHYVADVVGGVIIALLSVIIGARFAGLRLSTKHTVTV